jgi:hypothetical protein
MKPLAKFSFLLLLIAFSGCEKKSINTGVDLYVEQLISGHYEASELPAFSPSDIPALLKYRNETTIVSKYPHNGISSLWGGDCKLGMLVLWTIESIRAIEINSRYLIGRFPSQNPILALRDSIELKLIYDGQSHIEAADAYNDWWHSGNILKDKMEIDPLKDTKYRWH